MAKANFVKSARKPIYARGKHVTYESKKGKRAGSKSVTRSAASRSNNFFTGCAGYELAHP